uniref:CARD domain-containing protein n=1 Tax=Magallana gigas TaxID=29159 RepID=A0A8W8L993_MAGGI
MPPTGVSVRAIDNKKRIISDSPKMALQEVQRGYLFMLEHIHEEAQLFGYLCRVCEAPFCDDEKKDMRDGKGYFKKKELLKRLISKGENACKEFLEKFKGFQNLFSQFQNAVQSVTNADGIQQNAFLTHDKLVDYEELLLEEMEPTAIADILYCHAVLSSDEHDAIDKMSNRRDKAKKLITKIGQQPDKIPVLCHALEQSKCSRAVEYIRNKTSNGPSYSSGINPEKCVRFNFRKNLKNFRDCISKKSLLDNLIKKCKVASTGDLEPKESYLIKTGLRNGKGGCVCILELTEQRDLSLLKKLVERLDKRRKDGKEASN